MLRGKIIENGKYVVFNNGSVWVRNWHNTGKPKKANLPRNTSGYLQLRIKDKKVCVHRLIAECFLPNPNNLPEINHINEIKTDNRVENLELCDRKYNNNYGTHNKKIAKALSKPVLQYTLDGQFVTEYPSLREVERQLGYNSGCISECCNRKSKSAYGYFWKFKTDI